MKSLILICLYVDSNKPQKEEPPEAYTCVAIDSSHKVADHYNVHEKLGVWVTLVIHKACTPDKNSQEASEILTCE